MLRALGRLWFTPAPATRLAVLRLLVGAYSLWYLRRRVRMLRRIGETDPGLFRPVGVARVLDRPLRPEVNKALILATLGGNAAFLLGWRHRVTGPAFAGLLLWTLTYRNSWSMIFHSDNVLVLHTGILALTPSADALSLDALSRTGRPPAAPEWRYGWPVNLMRAATAATYLVAGVAKVKGPLGWKWASGEALRSQVAIDGLRKELLGSGAAPLGSRLYKRVGLYRLLAVGSLAAELVAPLVLPSRRLARLWAVAAFAMHWGIYAVMGIKFRYQMSGVMYAPYFDVERLLPGVAVTTAVSGGLDRFRTCGLSRVRRALSH